MTTTGKLQFTKYGLDENLILLRNCLEQVNLHQGEVDNLPLKLDLLATVLKKLIHQPNSGSVLCEALRHIPSLTEGYLENLCTGLKFSFPEQIGLGLALADANDEYLQRVGLSFCKARIEEIYENAECGLSESLIEEIIWFLHQNEDTKHVDSFLKALPSLQPKAVNSLLLTPLLQEHMDEVNCLRSFDRVAATGLVTSLDMMSSLSTATRVADVMEELGYSCTVDVDHCKGIFALFPDLSEADVAQVVGMVARTYKGLEDLQGTHSTFCTALCNGEQVSTDWLTTWDIDVLLESISQLAPKLNWRLVVEKLDHEGFLLPDQKSFSLLLRIYGKACQEIFPLEAVCGHLWKNGEGQLSFLKHAVLAPPDVFTFAHSLRKQSYKHSAASPNQAWLSLDLLEILCHLAEAGHISSVRTLLEIPLQHCPELLVFGLAQIKTEWSTIQSEMLPMLLPSYFASNATNNILQELWLLNPALIIKTMVEMHASDSSCIPRILDVCHELKVISRVLESTPFAFSVEFAAIAARRDFLNLEKWLQDNLTIHRDSFFQACLKFLRERTLPEARTDRQVGSGGITGQRPGHIVSLALDTTHTFFKVLQSNSGQIMSQELVEDLKNVKEAAIRVNPRLMSVGASDQSQAETYGSDVEEEANSYFQKIYIGQLTIDDVVDMLQRFNLAPANSREKAIFACMLQSLFEEYQFFPRYPERELKITAVLFGSLIKHQLVSSITLGHALRCVLDALRKPLDSKMFSFGSTALDQFKDRLVEWPQYCNHILQISHIRESQSELVDFIERALMRGGRAQHEIAGNGAFPTDQHFGSSVQSGSPSSLMPMEILDSSDGDDKKSVNLQPRISGSEVLDATLHAALGSSMVLNGTFLGQAGTESNFQSPESAPLPMQFTGQALTLQEERVKITNPVLSQSGPSQQSAAGSQTFDLSSGQKALQLASQGATYSALANGQLVGSTNIRSKTGAIAGVLRQPSTAAGFGHALNIGTLVAAAESRESPIEAPSSESQDKVAFIINNISITNLELKAKECLEVLKEQYYPWFAQYMVMKRASIEPNFHDLYLKFLDKLNSKGLQKEVLKASYENCKVLLRSDLIKISSEERSLLKNLGSWLGKLTIGRNQALRAREVDPKSLIIEAYEKGLMIAVIPFTSKVLEPCQSSLAYQPPNPWTMGILGLLAEIYAMPALKMNLKFDIEVLFKTLNVDLKDVKPTQLLGGRERDLEGNPDFSTKDLTGHQQAPLAPPGPVRAPVAAPSQPLELPPEPPGSTSLPSLPPTPTASQLFEEEKMTSLSPAERLQPGQGPSQSTQAFSASQVAMSIPNLTHYVVLNAKLTGLVQQLQLQRIVPLAMDRAIREIITPVVDRSVTIACMTTRELVMKDYAMEADENQTRNSAGLMVASLAGSLAHVTCKEPLRVAMASHLRSLLQVVNLAGEALDQAVNLVTNDNLDLGCAVIEKSATEKAQRDLADAIGPALSVRRSKRDGNSAAYYDASFYSGPTLARLPEILRPKPGRLTNAQQRVYEDFARLPWQNQQSQPVSAPAGPPSGSSLPSSVPYANGQGNAPAFYNGHSQASTGGLHQVADIGPDDLDLQVQSPLSFSSSASAIAADGSTQQSQDANLLLPHFTGNASSPLDVNGSEVTSAFKGTPNPGAFSPPPPLPIEQLGPAMVESSLTTGEVMEKYHLVAQKLDIAVSKVASMSYATLPSDHEVRTIVTELQEIITQAISRDEAALAIAQKIFQRLYENASSPMHMSVHLTILEAIRDVCKRVVKELTSWVIYSDEERRFNRDITVGLIRSELMNLSDYNVQLAKLIDGGRNKDAVEFAAYLVKTCVIEDAGVSNTEFYNVIDALGKLAARPGSPESLQQLVEIARTTSTAAGQGVTGTSKDDKVRLAKDKKVPSSRSSGLREDGKIGTRDTAAGDPVGLRDQVAALFDEWAIVCEAPGATDKAYAGYMSQLQHSGMLKGDDTSDRFFRILIELAVAHCVNTETLPNSGLGESRQQGANLSFAAIDMFAKLVMLLVKYYVDPSMSKVNLLNKVMVVMVRVIQRDYNEKKASFNPRPYFRLFVTWLMEFNSADSTLDSSNFQVLTTFGNALWALQPLQVPGWSFAWLELISHRMFMPKLLLSHSQKGWPLFQRLLVALFKFMEPYLRNADVSDPVRLLYKGTLRVLLVLLHDFPEFLCDHHFSFCDVIPPSCIQMRNLILSAFPRNMRLPDPFTPNLKVDLLPEISQAPHILFDVESALKNKQLKAEVDDYLKTRHSQSFQSLDIKARLLLPASEAVPCGTKYNVPLLNALVLYIGMQAIQQLQSKTTPQQLAVPTAPITHSAPMDIFQRLITDLDTEGRYLFLNAVANQLRYPNNHTHYFSCVLLYLFAEANLEIIQEQITRVLLERLIVNRPHPWGLLITFIELIKNPRYNFWSHSFTRCAPEIEKLFESVARSCMGPSSKASDDDLTASLTVDGLKV